MRHIHLADQLRIRFPGRSEEFNEGMEVGMIAILMSLGGLEIQRRVSPGSLEQLCAVASKLGYYLGHQTPDAEGVEVTFYARRARPKLTLIHSRSDEEKVPAVSR